MCDTSQKGYKIAAGLSHHILRKYSSSSSSSSSSEKKYCDKLERWKFEEIFKESVETCMLCFYLK